MAENNSFQLPEGYVACLLIQTIDGIKEQKLVAVKKDVCERYQQPLFQQNNEAAPLLQNRQDAVPQQYPPADQYQGGQQGGPGGQFYYGQQVGQPFQGQPYGQPYGQQFGQPYGQSIPIQQPNEYEAAMAAQAAQAAQAARAAQEAQAARAAQEARAAEEARAAQLRGEPPLNYDPNFRELEEKQNLVSIHNKICCSVSFYMIVQVACILIQYLLNGSLMAAQLWIASAVFLVVSMCFGCFGTRNSQCCLQTTHLILTIIFFILNVAGFAVAVQHPVLHEYVKPGYMVYNMRLLDQTSQSYTDCEYLKSHYPVYYQEQQSECDFQIMINENPNYGDTIIIDEGEEQLDESTSISEYTTSLQKGLVAVYAFGLLIALILLIFMIKTYRRFYKFQEQVDLHLRFPAQHVNPAPGPVG